MSKKIEINNIKSLCNVEDSELLFGIPLPPKYQCPEIDKIISALHDCEKEANSIEKYDDVNDCHSSASDIGWDLSSLLSDVEKLRKEIEKLRSWGEEWKGLAKTLIEHNPNILLSVIEDVLHDKVKNYLNETKIH